MAKENWKQSFETLLIAKNAFTVDFIIIFPFILFYAFQYKRGVISLWRHVALFYAVWPLSIEKGRES